MPKTAKKPSNLITYQPPNPLPSGLIIEDIYKYKWKLGPLISTGGCGIIYLTQKSPPSDENEYPYVMKIEYSENSPLHCELNFYCKFGTQENIQGYKKKKPLTSLGISPYISSGFLLYQDRNYRFLVMDKLESNIEKIFNENNCKFSSKTVFQLAVQILDALEYVHSNGYIHWDIKGSNILLGKNSEAKKQVYLIDFGLSAPYSSSENPDRRNAHNGTMEFISRDGHLGILSRRGDLETLGYNLIHWLGYTLPWETDLSNYASVQKSKENYLKNLTNFFDACFGNDKPPHELVQYMEYVTNLTFDVTPDYKNLKQLLTTGIKNNDGSPSFDFKFDSTETPVKRTFEVMEKAVKKPKKTNGYKLPDPLPLGLILEDIAKKKWKLGPSIGKGGFGEIYSAQEFSTTSKNSYPYVIKIEPHTNGPLFVEMHFYMRNAKREFVQAFQKEKKLKSLGMPTYLGSGRHEHDNQIYRFVVMEKFGTDVWKLFVENNHKFSPETVFKLGTQILDVLEYIHSKGYIHADIKGANVLLGLNSEATTQVYLVDFGLCTHYSSTDKPNPKKAHNGTLQYVSRDGHLGVESRRGDLEILGYNLVQWLGCNLPWDNKNCKTPVAVQESKEKYMKNLPDFFKTCFGIVKPPNAILEYMKYVVSLKFEDDPDYKKLKNILVSGLETAGGSVESAFNFKSIKSPNKRKVTKDLSPPKKVAEGKKKKVASKAEPINEASKKKTKKKNDADELNGNDADQVNQDDSTAGFTEAMLEIRNKMKSKKESVKQKTVSSNKRLRTRKNVNYNERSRSNVSTDNISFSDNETISPRRRRQ